MYHGTDWVFFAIHMAGLPDVANSLYAIRKLVFEKQLVTLPELVRILKDDWKDAEGLRLQFYHSLKYYGNDNPEVDEILRKVSHVDLRLSAGIRKTSGRRTIINVIISSYMMFSLSTGFLPQT